MSGQQPHSSGPRQAVDRMPQVGKTIAERYRLTGKIAAGGMGVIMRAEQLSMERDVAVKLLHPHMAEDPDTVRRFRREVELAKQLNHPNVIQVFDVGRTDQDVLFLVMEFLDGEELKQTLRRDAPLPVGRAVDIVSQTLDGLAEAHDNGVIHRDLKPSNIFLLQKRRGDHVKLLDFGIAKSLESEHTALTKTGQLCGTANYMPPETFLQSSPGPPGDVYAVGLILLEMLTGRQTVSGDSMPETVMLHLKKPIELPEPIAQSPLADIIKGATAKHPDDRYRDADDMLDALEQIEPNLNRKFRLSTNSIPSADSHSQLGKFNADANLSVLRNAPSHEIGGQDSAPPQTPSPESPTTGVQTGNFDSSGQLDDEATEFLKDLGDDRENRPSFSDDSPAPATARSKDRRASSPSSQTASDLNVDANSSEAGSWLETIDLRAAAAIATAGVILCLGGVGTYLYLDSTATESPTATASGPQETVQIELETTPSGAKVVRDGNTLGRTPLEHSVPHADTTESWTIRKSGFTPRDVDVTPDSDQAYTFQLERSENQRKTDNSDGESESDNVQVFKAGELNPEQSETSDDPSEPTATAGNTEESDGETSTDPDPASDDSTSSTSGPSDGESPKPAEDDEPTTTTDPAAPPQTESGPPEDESTAGETDDGSENDLDELFEQHKLESD